MRVMVRLFLNSVDAFWFNEIFMFYFRCRILLSDWEHFTYWSGLPGGVWQLSHNLCLFCFFKTHVFILAHNLAVTFVALAQALQLPARWGFIVQRVPPLHYNALQAHMDRKWVFKPRPAPVYAVPAHIVHWAPPLPFHVRRGIYI